MNNPLILVWYYLRHHPYKTMILVLSVMLTLYLPLTVYLLVNDYQARLTARAESTPIVIGPKGNRFDLVFHALYFRVKPPTGLTMNEVELIRDSGLAQPIPLHGMFTARGSSIIGTSIEYFDFRNLSMALGDPFMILGDCVLGASVAQKLELAPGDHLMSDPANVFDIAGDYPLNMRVSGVLEESGTVDDEAVFVDIKTAWVIQGLGHGHQDLAEVTDEGVLLKNEKGNVVASSALMHYREITPDNIDTFHFHGELDQFPLTGLICVPRDLKSATLLAGRYQDSRSSLQLLVPGEVVRELFDLIFKVKRFFDANVWLISISTVLLLILVILLSNRLRQREMRTMFYLGCSRGIIWKLQTYELGIIFVCSLILAGALTYATMLYAPYWIDILFVDVK